MTNFVKFSDVKKKRIQLEQLRKDGMSNVFGGTVPIYNEYGVDDCISMYSVSMYSVSLYSVRDIIAQ